MGRCRQGNLDGLHEGRTALAESHREAEVDGPVADLPHAESWTIEGISADDRWVVVASEDTGSLVVVDRATSAIEIARLQGGFNPTPMFGGWVH